MRPALLCGVLFLVAAGGAAADEATDREQIVAARQQWLKAFFAGDTKTMDRLEGDKFMVLAGNIVSDKQTQLARIKQQVDAGEWFPQGFQNVDIDVTIRFLDKDVAIASGHSANKGPDDEQPRMRFAVTEVWHRIDDQWRAEHLHFHPLEGPDSD